MKESSTARSIDRRPVRGGTVLTPSRVTAMIRARSAYRVVKSARRARTACPTSDPTRTLTRCSTGPGSRRTPAAS
jgi:hypothetical protein